MTSNQHDKISLESIVLRVKSTSTKQFVDVIYALHRFACLIYNIGTQGVQESFFCDLKAPGGCSTRWSHKGNSFKCTGVPDSSQCHYKV